VERLRLAVHVSEAGHAARAAATAAATEAEEAIAAAAAEAWRAVSFGPEEEVLQEHAERQQLAVHVTGSGRAAQAAATATAVAVEAAAPARVTRTTVAVEAVAGAHPTWWRLLPESSGPMEAPTRMTCVLCLAAFNPAHGVACGGRPQHFLCGNQKGSDCLGTTVQVDPMKPELKPPGTKRLKLKCDILLSTSAFKFNLRRYTLGGTCARAWRRCASPTSVAIWQRRRRRRRRQRTPAGWPSSAARYIAPWAGAGHR
jgi:hypothetical protein